MSRWSQYDEDDHRLPSGMKRVGYDADTQTYTYQDEDGGYWEGAEGARYGTLTRVGTEPEPISTHESQLPSLARRTRILDFAKNGTHREHNTWRLLSPFILLVFLALFLLFYFLTGSPAPDGRSNLGHTCKENESGYTIQPGDTCWAIAQEHGMSVEGIVAKNEGLDCHRLQVGELICVINRP